MKIQIARFSPHQNAKVFAILMAVSSLLFAVPIFIVLLAVPPGVDAHGNPIHGPPAFLFLLLPVVYLVMGYIRTAAGCAIYNFLSRYVGGIEYEVRDS